MRMSLMLLVVFQVDGDHLNLVVWTPDDGGVAKVVLSEDMCPGFRVNFDTIKHANVNNVEISLG